MLQGQLRSLESSTCKENKAPTKVCWNLTSHCNLKCEFCYGPQGFEKELNTRQVKAIVEKLRKAGVERVVLSGGEPLLRKDLLEIIEFASSCGLNVSVATNGLLLDEEFVSKAAKHLGLVEISLDGGDEKTEVLMRGKHGLFGKTIECLELLERYGMKIKINTMVSKKNYGTLKEIGEIAEKYGANCWKIFQFVPRNRGKCHQKEFEISASEFKSLKQKIGASFPNLNIIWASKSYFSKSYFNIYPDGSVSVPKIATEARVGNILSQTVEEIWGNEAFNKEKHLQQTSVAYES